LEKRVILGQIGSVSEWQPRSYREYREQTCEAASTRTADNIPVANQKMAKAAKSQ
jgi:hypothetical protein